MAELIGGLPANITPLERELISLIKKNFATPARLKPEDLDPLRNIVGDDVYDYLLVIAGFHFVNRIADLLDVSLEGLPKALRRIKILRRLNQRTAGFLLSKMDLANREYQLTYDHTMINLQSSMPGTSGVGMENTLAMFESRPKLVEIYQMLLAERDERSSLDRKVLVKIHRAVEKALPATVLDSQGVHAVPESPVEALAFVGTRYAFRTTKQMIEELQQRGYDDLGILDLAIAVADANLWARLHRLTGLAPELYYLHLRRDD